MKLARRENGLAVATGRSPILLLKRRLLTPRSTEPVPEKRLEQANDVGIGFGLSIAA